MCKYNGHLVLFALATFWTRWPIKRAGERRAPSRLPGGGLGYVKILSHSCAHVGWIDVVEKPHGVCRHFRPGSLVQLLAFKNRIPNGPHAARGVSGEVANVHVFKYCYRRRVIIVRVILVSSKFYFWQVVRFQIQGENYGHPSLMLKTLQASQSRIEAAEGGIRTSNNIARC